MSAVRASISENPSTVRVRTSDGNGTNVYDRQSRLIAEVLSARVPFPKQPADRPIKPATRHVIVTTGRVEKKYFTRHLRSDTVSQCAARNRQRDRQEEGYLFKWKNPSRIVRKCSRYVMGESREITISDMLRAPPVSYVRTARGVCNAYVRHLGVRSVVM